jgi:hypothetical protein
MAQTIQPLRTGSGVRPYSLTVLKDIGSSLRMAARSSVATLLAHLVARSHTSARYTVGFSAASVPRPRGANESVQMKRHKETH